MSISWSPIGITFDTTILLSGAASLNDVMLSMRLFPTSAADSFPRRLFIPVWMIII